MAAKVFKTIDEQLQILKDKGMVFEDEDYAKETLLRENYFFINGYRHPFLRDDGSKKFVSGCMFKEMHALFAFDRNFRNIIFKNVLIVENNYKSIYSYVMSKNYGYKEKEYLKISNFDNDRSKIRQINDLLRKLKRQIAVNGGQHQATSHYINNYGYIPLWIGVKVLSFGIISELYTILKAQDKEEIAALFDIDSERFAIYLSLLSNYRNLCAHEDILYNHTTQKIIPDTRYHTLLGIETTEDEYVDGKNDIFALILILKSMLSVEDFKMVMNEIVYEIETLESKLRCIKIDKILEIMGFPENYKEIMYLK